jgi:hypothetical protein
MRPDGESRQGRRNTTCIQQHMRTNLRTESGRYGCRSLVICCRISISPCIRPKKQRTFGSQVPTAASGKNRNSLNIRRADRPYPCGFCGGSLCANSGHSLSTTARISSEVWSMCSISSDPVDALVHRVFDFHGGPPLRVHSMKCSAPVLDIHCTTDPLRRSAWVVRRTRAVRSRYRSFDDLTREQSYGTQNGKNGPVH